MTSDTPPTFQIHDVVWTPSVIQQFWEVEVAQVQNSFARRHGHRIVPLIRRYIRPPARLLDVGGGPGFLTHQLLRAGYQVATVEETITGRHLTHYLNSGIPGFLGVMPLTTVAANARFQGAVGVEVLEHLNNADIGRIFELLRHSVEPKGICVFTTPHDEDLAAKQVGCPDCGARFHRWQHVRSLTCQGLSDLLTCPGFAPVRVFATDWSRRTPAPLRSRLRPGTGPHLVGVTRREGAYSNPSCGDAGRR